MIEGSMESKTAELVTRVVTASAIEITNTEVSSIEITSNRKITNNATIILQEFECHYSLQVLTLTIHHFAK